MRLPVPSIEYTPSVENMRNQTIENADALNYKVNKDVEITGDQRLIIKSADGSRFKIVVSDAGVLSATSI